ncbi:zinc-binding dehydrogenase [Shinella sp.]|uniref:zinc-binding dehydrogenase n=1 Tax=Shinella sp. TaxID=1870904 RepID=UPI0039E2E1DB
MKVPPQLPFECAALLGCAVITGAGAVLNGSGVAPGNTVAVIGCGGIGLNAVQAARLAGAQRVFGIDIDPAELELAKRSGATDVIHAEENDATGLIHEATGGGVDFAFECVGREATVRDAVAMLRPGAPRM